jgi:hypothetical protein
MIVSGVASSVWAEKSSAIMMQGHGLGGMVVDTACGGSARSQPIRSALRRRRPGSARRWRGKLLAFTATWSPGWTVEESTRFVGGIPAAPAALAGQGQQTARTIRIIRERPRACAVTPLRFRIVCARPDLGPILRFNLATVRVRRRNIPESGSAGAPTSHALWRQGQGCGLRESSKCLRTLLRNDWAPFEFSARFLPPMRPLCSS